MNCKNCGKPLVGDELFCANCGSCVEEKSEKICPACGKHADEGSMFCGECGYRFEQQIQQSSGLHTVHNRERQYNKSENSNMTLYLIVTIVAVIAVIVASVFIFGEKPEKINVREQKVEYRTEEAERKEEKDAEEIADNGDDEFLLPSHKRYLTLNDLLGRTKEEVALIRNEIYARHGYIFSTQAYAEYFGEKDWYEPNPYFDEAMFSEIERANKDFIVEYEKSMGWR